jgi:integrase
MSFIDQIKDKLLDNKLTISSIELYIKNLTRLNDDEPLKNFKFLDDIPSIESKLNKYKLNTKKIYFISIVSILNVFKDDSKKIKILYDKYYKLMKSTADEVKKIPSSEMNDNQKKNWISWEDLKNEYNIIKTRITSYKNLDKLNESQYNHLLKYVILSLYMLQEPRRNEYIKTKLILKYNEKLSENFNYISLNDKEIIFNEYKTKKKYGQQIIKLNNDLYDVIKLYLRFHPLYEKGLDIPFLVYYNGKPFKDVNSITRILSSIHHGLGSSLIRHIYLSYKFGDINNEKEDTANNMGHSVQTQNEYIKKV